MPADGDPLAFTLGRLTTPIGTLLVVTDRMDRLRAIITLADGTAPTSVRTAMEAYFAGELAAIDRLPVATGGTGVPAAVRAVGAANGANPISIVVPCHRVIGADASLTGYGGGLPRKHWLLAHEGAVFKSSADSSPARLPGL